LRKKPPLQAAGLHAERQLVKKVLITGWVWGWLLLTGYSIELSEFKLSTWLIWEGPAGLVDLLGMIAFFMFLAFGPPLASIYTLFLATKHKLRLRFSTYLHIIWAELNSP
jgi:hypothetical protein